MSPCKLSRRTLAASYLSALFVLEVFANDATLPLNYHPSPTCAEGSKECLSSTGALLLQVSAGLKVVSPSEVALLQIPTGEIEASDALTEPIRTFVINLPGRTDRWAHMLARLLPLNETDKTKVPWRQPVLHVTRLDATNGSVDPIPVDAVAMQWSTNRNAPYAHLGYMDLAYAGNELTLSGSERACSMSHIRLWREIAKSEDSKPTLILEDDGVLSSDFDTKLPQLLSSIKKLPSRHAPDLVYLGYSVGAPLKREVAVGLVEAEYLWTTIGYLLWPAGAKKLLAELPVNQPTDNFVAWLVKTRRLKAFAASPKIVEPEGTWDVGSDVQHSDEKVDFLLLRVNKMFKSLTTPLRDAWSSLMHIATPKHGV